ncbi:hypothetical protein THAOC_24300, partial [Thalassiosira oceanica]
TLDFPTLVPPHNGAALLLALLRYDETRPDCSSW